METMKIGVHMRRHLCAPQKGKRRLQSGKIKDLGLNLEKKVTDKI